MNHIRPHLLDVVGFTTFLKELTLEGEYDMKRFVSFLLALCLLCCCAAFAEEPAGTTYTFEFEDCDFTGMVGDGNSGSAFEWEMVGTIPAFGIKIPEGQEPSNKHFVYFNYTAGLTFDFEVTASQATTANMVVRFGSEIGNIVDLGPEAGMAIMVNGVALDYAPFTVESLPINGGPVPYTFADYEISAPVELNEGVNNVTFVILQRKTLSSPNDAPTMDCFKLTVQDDTVLTHTNNYQELNDYPGYIL